MLAWIISGVTTLGMIVVVWYYRSRASGDAVATVATSAVTAKLNSVLATQAAKAVVLDKIDQDHANAVKTSKDAADFLNASVSTNPSGVPRANLCTAVRPPTPCFVYGFVRGPGCDYSHPGCGPGSVDFSRATVA